MDFKKEIEKLLSDLKKMNIDRRKIEKDLSYKEFYIDQVLSKGGNEKFLNTLQRYHIEKSNKSNMDTPTPNPQDQAHITDVFEKMILNLIESNNRLVETVNKQAEVHLVEAEANRFLAQTNFGAMKRLTNSDNSTEGQPSFSSQLRQAVATMAMNGLNHSYKWETVKEGEIILSKLLSSGPGENQQYNNDRNGADKSSK